MPAKPSDEYLDLSTRFRANRAQTDALALQFRYLVLRVASLEELSRNLRPIDVSSRENNVGERESRLEALGKTCETLQNGIREIRVTASTQNESFEKLAQRVEQGVKCLEKQAQRVRDLEEYVQWLEKQVPGFETLQEQMERVETLEKQIRNLEQGCKQSHNETRVTIENVEEKVNTASKKQLDDVEKRATGDEQQFEDLQKKVLANGRRLDTMADLFSDLVHGQPGQPSTGQKRKGDHLTLTTRPKRVLRPRA